MGTQIYIECPVSKMAVEEMRHGISPLKHVIHLKGVLSTILFHRTSGSIVPGMDCEDAHCRFPVVQRVENSDSQQASVTMNQKVEECIKELSFWFAQFDERRLDQLSPSPSREQTPPGSPLRSSNPGSASTITLKLTQGNNDSLEPWETWTIASQMTNSYRIATENGSSSKEYGHSSHFEQFLISLAAFCYELGIQNPPHQLAPPHIDMYVGTPDHSEAGNEFDRWKRFIKKMLQPGCERGGEVG
ncbi:LAME_0E09054g1_1 [Lachancea meyersii CBS 8951]|uniref:LAME_0E09054g1_1 n=1 Tax=Lachancea meyersii CBS 8951 TaxID=1266667 RepID=A0A1G4JJZ2_9SACH|nr:LAME_0E09054g1_1 [Lachancea meyersii CBS 8951]